MLHNHHRYDSYRLFCGVGIKDLRKLRLAMEFVSATGLTAGVRFPAIKIIYC
jgi:hypothetical protein